MAEVRQQSTATFRIEIDGSALSDDVQTLMNYAVVEDNLNLPDSFLLSFLDPDRIVVGKAGLQVAAEVKISVLSELYPSGEPIFSGEVTALEAEFDAGKTRTIVRGFDKANRLYRGRRTRAFKDVKYSDVVKKVASDAGLSVGRVETPNGKPVRHLSQANLTDAEFLTMLAGEVGYVVLVESGKVNFHAPTESTEAPTEGDEDARDPLQLTQGDNLLRFSSVVTSDSQIKDVSVRGWDISDKRALVATAPAKTTTAAVGTTPADLAAAFDNRTFVAAEVPYGEQSQVEAAAGALAEQIAGAHALFEGVARGNAKLRAGSAVSLGLVGSPFDGKYVLTATRHVYDNGEYLVHFQSTGRMERSLQSLASGGGSAATISPAFVSAPITGVVSAIVTNVKDDDDKLGQVKVKIPRLDDDYESDWMRGVQPGAGKDRGAIVIPEVDDEVLVAFENGDIRRGYVIGGLYNGVDTPNRAAYKDAVGGDGKVVKRSFTSRKGHFMLIDDTDGAEFVELATKDSKFSLKLAKDQEGGLILLASDKLVTIDAKGDITIRSQAKITIDATSDLSLHGRKVSIKADSDLEVSGMNVKIAGNAQTEMTGAQTKVAGNATLSLEGGGQATLRGALVKIN